MSVKSMEREKIGENTPFGETVREILEEGRPSSPLGSKYPQTPGPVY